MQIVIALAIVAVCLVGILRGLARSISPARFKAKAGGTCCAGGCPALKSAPAAHGPDRDASEHRPAA